VTQRYLDKILVMIFMILAPVFSCAGQKCNIGANDTI
jgi:hypothetical protein